ncbi:unnamed protein product [Rotaria magnacalcarata]|uniref:Peptidyl-prolyl cis-trans isomerase n=2 Tax=Rotaria magnacalcarata TaxID=392030 RepID=A0A814UVR1_9BILA|nr:unnamed protein product [Rotaria magnacalcarata]CAF2111624.1 unnamed protein product [Rotaria magnacalcarata]CAF3787113.1 unnamed protein product [Rotaria magnacalcarata]CAF3925318.1 unnamed protein product [Rotaria magnacalcarata]CAF4059128.1 unnamed protein product [Rotaria magnacalcarata]
MMIKFFNLVVLVSVCSLKQTVSGVADSNFPSQFTITHEAVFDIVIKENMNTNEVLRQGRVVIGLFGNIVPMTVLNFVTIANGIFRRDINYTYDGVPFHRIVKDFCIQTGDFVNRDGTGSMSIYGTKFVDENFRLSHKSAGWVSMANYGKDTNGSQFFITLVPARWLDGHHVVFGRVVQGIDFIHEIGEVDTFPGTSLPKKYVGILKASAKEVSRYDLALEDLISTEDIIVA